MNNSFPFDSVHIPCSQDHRIVYSNGLNISTELASTGTWKITKESGATVEDMKTHPIILNHYQFQSKEVWAKKVKNDDGAFAGRYSWEPFNVANMCGHFTDSTLEKRQSRRRKGNAHSFPAISKEEEEEEEEKDLEED